MGGRKQILGGIEYPNLVRIGVDYRQTPHIETNSSTIDIYYCARFDLADKGGQIYTKNNRPLKVTFYVRPNGNNFYNPHEKPLVFTKDIPCPVNCPGKKTIDLYHFSFETKHDKNGNGQFHIRLDVSEGFYLNYDSSGGVYGRDKPLYDLPNGAGSLVCYLDKLPETSVLNFASVVYLGDTLTINVKRNISKYKQDIIAKIPMGNGEYETIPIVEGSEETQIKWLVPISISRYFPKSKSLTGKILCLDKKPDGTTAFTKEYPITFQINTDVAGPIVERIIKDINPATTALTSSNQYIVSGESRMQYEITAKPQYDATIEKYYISNGEVSYETPTGIFEKPINRYFDIAVIDSRGLTTATSTSMFFIPYTLPNITLSNNKPNVDGEYVVDTSGLWFNQSFSKVDNEITVQYSIQERSSSAEKEWITVPHTVPKEGEFKVVYTATGLDYRKTYRVQTRVIDKLHTAYSEEKIVKALPVFDWGEDVINFNTPIDMKNTQVLDIDEISKDVVLSGGGELIHIRPRSKGSSLRELTIGGNELLYNGKPVGGGGGGSQDNTVETAMSDSVNITQSISYGPGYSYSAGNFPGLYDNHNLTLNGNVLSFSQWINKNSNVTAGDKILTFNLNQLNKRIKSVLNNSMEVAMNDGRGSVRLDFDRVEYPTTLTLYAQPRMTFKSWYVGASIPVLLDFNAWR